MSIECAPMLWHQTWRADPRAAAMADKHYSRQTVGAQQFSPPGRALVLVTEDYDALWVTSWPFAEYVHRMWFPGGWVCSLFRNESPHLSSDMIRQAVAATRAVYGEPPADGMVTMVNEAKVRHKRDPGRCFRKAGFEPAGRTQEEGLLVLHLPPDRMPEASPPIGMQLSLMEALTA